MVGTRVCSMFYGWGTIIKETPCFFIVKYDNGHYQLYSKGD